jgi:F0F1-type ATP synthase membrane subunit b/b'
MHDPLSPLRPAGAEDRANLPGLDPRGWLGATMRRMSDRSRELQETLDQLHEQLEHAKPVDAEARARLREALDEIRTVLAQAEDRAEEPELDQSLRDRLSEMTQHFEGEHPALTAALSRVINALSALGI